MERKGPNKSNYVKDKILGIDTFGEAFNFKMPGGNDTYNTGLGAFFTLIVLVVLLFYGGLQMQRLAIYGETVVTMSVRDSYFTPEEIFPDEIELIYTDFNIVVAFTAYDSVTERIDDPTYG